MQLNKVKQWTRGVAVEDAAARQIANVAALDIVQPHVAIMPDVHWGFGATVGSVIPTVGAVIPAAVGVDIGCGMIAVGLSLTANDLPDNLFALRSAIEAAVPHGRTNDGGRGDRGAWGTVPQEVQYRFDASLRPDLDDIRERNPTMRGANDVHHLGTLGSGNHFIEICLDETQHVWVMLHSGSRGIGNRIGTHFIELAKRDMERNAIQLPDRDLAYLVEGSEVFDEYVAAVDWAQRFAQFNREIALDATLRAIRATLPRLPAFDIRRTAINCHHNYVQRERHFERDLWLTRKGAVSARRGEYGIIPGSMGAKSFIVRGLGNAESFCSCSHGAGRVMSRTEAKKRFTLADHARATHGVECRKDADVIDETPGAYKDVDAVMAAQSDLVEISHTLKQVVCVKG